MLVFTECTPPLAPVEHVGGENDLREAPVQLGADIDAVLG